MQARLLDSILLPRPHAFKLYILYIFLSIGNSSFYTFLSTFLLMFMRHVTKALRCNIGLSKKSCPDSIATGTAFFIFYFASESSDLENAFKYSSSKSSVSISASVIIIHHLQMLPQLPLQPRLHHQTHHKSSESS